MTPVVSEFEQAQDRRHFQSLDDVSLVEAMLGLNAEMSGAPTWGVTPRARYIRRMLFTEITDRWIPPEIFAEAISRVIEGTEDA